MTRQLGYATAAILAAIARGHRYGLEIMEITGLPSGTVYPTLTRMETRAYLTAHWEAAGVAEREKRPRRRYYKITAAGRRALAESSALYGSLGLGTLVRER